MKRLILIALALLISACDAPKAKGYESSLSKEKRYESSFGFSVEIPSHWLVVTSQEIKDNPDLFDLQKVDSGYMDKDFLREIIQMVRSGKIEYWFNTLTSDSQFNDNVSVGKLLGAIPKNENDLPSLSELASEGSKFYGRRINCYTCELREVNGINTMYIDCDGAMKGTRSIQYIFQKSNSVQIFITATCKNSVLDTVRGEFTNIVNSLRMTGARSNLDPQEPCEANCENMFENGELKPGMTVEECIKILCK
jgi:hypothetical protein